MNGVSTHMFFFSSVKCFKLVHD